MQQNRLDSETTNQRTSAHWQCENASKEQAAMQLVSNFNRIYSTMHANNSKTQYWMEQMRNFANGYDVYRMLWLRDAAQVGKTDAAIALLLANMCSSNNKQATVITPSMSGIGKQTLDRICEVAKGCGLFEEVVMEVNQVRIDKNRTIRLTTVTNNFGGLIGMFNLHNDILILDGVEIDLLAINKKLSQNMHTQQLIINDSKFLHIPRRDEFKHLITQQTYVTHAHKWNFQPITQDDEMLRFYTTIALHEDSKSFIVDYDSRTMKLGDGWQYIPMPTEYACSDDYSVVAGVLCGLEHAWFDGK